MTLKISKTQALTRVTLKMMTSKSLEYPLRRLLRKYLVQMTPFRLVTKTKTKKVTLLLKTFHKKTSMTDLPLLKTSFSNS